MALVGGRRPGPPPETGISVTPYMMSPGDETIVADRLYTLLSSRSLRDPAAAPVRRRWIWRADGTCGSNTPQDLDARPSSEAEGQRHRRHASGDFVARDVTGTISGSDVRLRSNYGAGGDSLSFTFAGKASGDGMSGSSTWGSI